MHALHSAHQIVVTDSLVNRFNLYAKRGASEDDCWHWTGYKNRKGYGMIHEGGSPKKHSKHIAYRGSFTTDRFQPGSACFTVVTTQSAQIQSTYSLEH